MLGWLDSLVLLVAVLCDGGGGVGGGDGIGGVGRDGSLLVLSVFVHGVVLRSGAGVEQAGLQPEARRAKRRTEETPGDGTALVPPPLPLSLILSLGSGAFVASGIPRCGWQMQNGAPRQLDTSPAVADLCTLPNRRACQAGRNGVLPPLCVWVCCLHICPHCG